MLRKRDNHLLAHPPHRDETDGLYYDRPKTPDGQTVPVLRRSAPPSRCGVTDGTRPGVLPPSPTGRPMTLIGKSLTRRDGAWVLVT